MFSDKNYIGQKIKEYRKKKKLSQAKLAEMVGLSDKHIGRVEAGQYVLSSTNFLKIVEILKINLSEFGFNNASTENEIETELLKIIKLSSLKEQELYLKIIKTIKENI